MFKSYESILKEHVWIVDKDKRTLTNSFPIQFKPRSRFNMYEIILEGGVLIVDRDKRALNSKVFIVLNLDMQDNMHAQTPLQIRWTCIEPTLLLFQKVKRCPSK